jgi:hypothetical protein
VPSCNLKEYLIPEPNADLKYIRVLRSQLLDFKVTFPVSFRANNALVKVQGLLQWQKQFELENFTKKQEHDAWHMFHQDCFGQRKHTGILNS